MADLLVPENAFTQTELEAADGNSGLVLRRYPNGKHWAFPWKKDDDGRPMVMIECDCSESAPHGVHWVHSFRMTDGDLAGKQIVGESYEGEGPPELVLEYA